MHDANSCGKNLTKTVSVNNTVKVNQINQPKMEYYNYMVNMTGEGRF